MTNEQLIILKNVSFISAVPIAAAVIIWFANKETRKALNESFKKLSFKKTAIRVVALLAIINIFGVSNDPQNNEQKEN